MRLLCPFYRIYDHKPSRRTPISSILTCACVLNLFFALPVVQFKIEVVYYCNSYTKSGSRQPVAHVCACACVQRQRTGAACVRYVCWVNVIMARYSINVSVRAHWRTYNVHTHTHVTVALPHAYSENRTKIEIVDVLAIFVFIPLLFVLWHFFFTFLRMGMPSISGVWRRECGVNRCCRATNFMTESMILFDFCELLAAQLPQILPEQKYTCILLYLFIYLNCCGAKFDEVE